MTVRDLIELLKNEDQDRLVVMSSDGEGNHYSEFADFGRMSFRDGEVGLDGLTADLEKKGYSEEDVLDGEKCIVFYPN